MTDLMRYWQRACQELRQSRHLPAIPGLDEALADMANWSEPPAPDPYLAHRRVLFVAASTVPVTPLVETFRVLAGSGEIRCRIPANLPKEFYEEFPKLLPAALGRRVSYETWDSSERERTCGELEKADALVVHGNDATISELAKLARQMSTRCFRGYGHKVSIAVAEGGNVSGLARDLWMYKQLGCLSPQAVWHLGPESERFAEHLAEAISDLDQWLTPPEAHTRRRALEDVLLREPRCHRYGSGVLLWPHQRPSHNHGTSGLGMVHVHPVKSLGELPAPESLPPLACVGHDLEPSSETQLRALYPEAGVRWCNLGKMQLPPPSWRQAPSLEWAG